MHTWYRKVRTFVRSASDSHIFYKMIIIYRSRALKPEARKPCPGESSAKGAADGYIQAATAATRSAADSGASKAFTAATRCTGGGDDGYAATAATRSAACGGVGYISCRCRHPLRSRRRLGCHSRHPLSSGEKPPCAETTTRGAATARPTRKGAAKSKGTLWEYPE
jgi:hypothetical protein